MEIDKATGFTVASTSWESQAFTAEKKTKFIQLASQYVEKSKNFPPIHDISRAVGTTAHTFYNHLKLDPVFKQAWREIQAQLESHFTQRIGEKANSKQGTLANIAVLRKLTAGTDRQGEWGGDSLNPVSSESPTKKIMEHFSEYIDAEIVPESSTNPTNNKQITGGNNGNYGA